MSWRRGIAAWLALAVVMVVHGTLREILLTPIAGPLRAHQLSTLTAAALILAVTWVLLPWIGARERGQRIRLGAAWLGLTVTFEFGFGHYVVGHSWSALLADYDLRAGRLWVVVLAITAAAPWLAGRIGRGRGA